MKATYLLLAGSACILLGVINLFWLLPNLWPWPSSFGLLFLRNSLFAVPLMGGVILLTGGFINLVPPRRRAPEPTPDTHVRCPDCNELVRREAIVCTRCGCRLIPQ